MQLSAYPVEASAPRGRLIEVLPVAHRGRILSQHERPYMDVIVCGARMIT